MFERLIFERIETRVMVGITMFVGVMLLVGWVAINEGGRMASFERQWNARSIERGAELYASQCSRCHGEGGLGNVEVAPGLNNPQLFGHDFLADIRTQMSALEAEQAALEAQRIALANELTAQGTSEERRSAIQAELESITARLNTDTDEQPSISTQLAELQQQRDTLIAQMQPAIDLGYDPDRPSRPANLGWAGSLHSFVYTTLVSGRPVSSSYWPNPMPAWSQTAGGPLRNDELEDLTAYVLNWDKGNDWTIEDLLAVQQFAKIPGQAETAGVEGAVGTEVEAILQRFADEAIVGDAERGDQIYHGAATTEGGRRLPCAGCHQGGLAAPATEGTWTRVQNERLAEPQFEGYTGEQYLVESIVHPQAYVVPGQPNNMPTNFGDILTAQDLADIVAYLQTQTQ